MSDVRNLISEARKKLRLENSDQDVFSLDDAKNIGNKLNLDWIKYNITEFHMGLNVELEHGTMYPKWNITDDDPIMTAKIALAHLEELPDYYSRLQDMEEVGKEM